MNHVGELESITNEEHWKIVANKIVVAICRVAVSHSNVSIIEYIAV